MRPADRLPRVLIVDDHDIFRIGLRTILAVNAGLEIAGETRTAEAAVASAKRLSPDLVVMELDLPGRNGIDAASQIIGTMPGIKIIALSVSADAGAVRRVLDAGAHGYVPKRRTRIELPVAVRSVLAGNLYLSPSVARDVLAVYASESGTPFRHGGGLLSTQERRVLELAADGRTSAETGALLGLEPGTVDALCRRIERKIGVTGMAELTKYALRQGFTKLD